MRTIDFLVQFHKIEGLTFDKSSLSDPIDENIWESTAVEIILRKS